MSIRYQGHPASHHLTQPDGGLGKRTRLRHVISLARVAFKQGNRHAASPPSSFRFNRRASHLRGLANGGPPPEKIQHTGDAKPGTILVQTGERSLYLITGNNQALNYTVGVRRSASNGSARRGSLANILGRRGSRPCLVAR